MNLALEDEAFEPGYPSERTEDASESAAGGQDTPYNVLDGKYLFDMSERCGHGATGRVYKGHRSTDGLSVAIKLIDRGTEALDESARRELAALERLGLRLRDHAARKHFAHLLDSERVGDVLVLVLERVRGYSLADLIAVQQQRRLSEAAVRDLARQLLVAAEGLHSSGVVHGDIGVRNIMIECNEDADVHPRRLVAGALVQGTVKIIDLGSALLTDVPQPRARENEDVSISSYAAPELFFGGPHRPAADMYSIGALLFDMLTGIVPEGSLHVPPSLGLSRACIELLASLLSRNPASRPSASEALKSPWFAEGASPRLEA
jgi:serine/threonine protein kinase